MVWWKCAGVWKEALRLGSTAVQAEVVNLQHANPPNPRRDFLLGLAPGLKRGSIQI
jgi:hypothetical protein